RTEGGLCVPVPRLELRRQRRHAPPKARRPATAVDRHLATSPAIAQRSGERPPFWSVLARKPERPLTQVRRRRYYAVRSGTVGGRRWPNLSQVRSRPGCSSRPHLPGLIPELF